MHTQSPVHDGNSATNTHPQSEVSHIMSTDTLAHVVQAGQELGPGSIRRAGLLLEHLVQGHALKLPVRLLVCGADSHVPDVRHVLAPSWWCRLSRHEIS